MLTSCVNNEKIILKREPDIKIEVIKASDYKLSFDGVDCAHCASVIENNINKLNNVNNCRIDFLNKTCSFSAYDFNDAFRKFFWSKGSIFCDSSLFSDSYGYSIYS